MTVNHDVTGSSPVGGAIAGEFSPAFFIRVWRSLVARLNGVQEAAGSTPVTRTIKIKDCFGNPLFLSNPKDWYVTSR